VLLETEGETAQALALRHQRPVVVYDLLRAIRWCWPRRPATRHGDAKAMRYLQQQGKKVVQIADYPGLLVWRTVAMIANEALDALQKGVASEKDIDTAMRLGVNYPQRPDGVGRTPGLARVLRCWRTCNTIMAKSAIAPVPCCARRRFWRAL
jgi:3-hydroxybutyryl-CoA dehydrogenase